MIHDDTDAIGHIADEQAARDEEAAMLAHETFDETCLFLTRSPYYTCAKYCSPCAPGAGNLDDPIEDGARTLCFGHEMFEDGRAPYRVFRVSDDTEVVAQS